MHVYINVFISSLSGNDVAYILRTGNIKCHGSRTCGGRINTLRNVFEYIWPCILYNKSLGLDSFID